MLRHLFRVCLQLLSFISLLALQVDIRRRPGCQGCLAGACVTASQQCQGGALQDLQRKALREHRDSGGQQRVEV